MEPSRSPGSAQPLARVLVRQLQGIDAWSSSVRRRREVLTRPGMSREAEVDAARKCAALDQAQLALVRRLHEVLAADPRPLAADTGRRAILAHRQDWFVRSTSAALAELGVTVVAALDNGADAVGAVVAEQPDLLLVEESLPMMTGRQVVDEAVRFAPATMLVVQVGHADRIGALLDAGVRTAVTRQVPPADVARQMHALLDSGAPPSDPQES